MPIERIVFISEGCILWFQHPRDDCPNSGRPEEVKVAIVNQFEAEKQILTNPPTCSLCHKPYNFDAYSGHYGHLGLQQKPGFSLC